MQKAKQRTLSTILLAVLLAASATMLWGQADQLQTNADVKKAQDSLHEKGYYNGQIDGIAGPRTERGIRQYQKAENLPVTGRLDVTTAGKLGVGSGSVGGSFKGAGQEVGQGSKEAGHEITQGKPVAAGKELGKGFGRAGKKAGHGIKEAVTTESDRGDREKKQAPADQQDPQ